MNDRVPDGSSVVQPFTVEHLKDLESIERIAPEWELLNARQFPWSPFTGPVWNLAWWRTLAEQKPSVTDRLAVRAVRSARGRLVAVAPWMLTERPATGPFRIRMLQFLGADPAITEARSVVCEPEHEHAVYRTLGDALDREPADWDFVRWSGIPANSAVIDRLASHSHASLSEGAPAFVLDLPSSWSELRARLPRNIKESLRKCYNSLRRDGLAFELRVAPAANAGEALGTFFRLHELRASVDSGITHANVFPSHQSRAFLRDYYASSPAENALVFELVIGGEVVATRLAFRSGAHLYLYYSGYSPAFSRYSVMTTLLAEVLKWSISEGIACVHLSFGRDVSKTRWRPREVPFVELRKPSPGVRGRVVQWAFGHADALRRHRHLGGVAHAVFNQLGGRATNRSLPSVQPFDTFATTRSRT